MSASRTKQRRLDRLQETVDRVLDGDRLFFERHPSRNHRLRLASQAEIELTGAVLGGHVLAQPGMRIYAVIRQIEPGARVRTFVANEPDLDVDISEFEAGWLFNHLAPAGSKIAEVEANLRQAMAKRGGAN